MTKNYNILAKRLPGKEYIITDMIGTKLSKKEFDIMQKYNSNILDNYYYIPFKETDFIWWSKVNKYLTKKRLVKNVYFYYDTILNKVIKEI